MSRAAVIFDCDGVLADSETLVVSAWIDVLCRHGYRPTERDVAACFGITDVDCYALVVASAREAGVELPRWSLIEREARALIELRYPHELRAFPDATEAVRALAMEGLPLAVASSSPRWRLDMTLELLGLARYFDQTVAGDDRRHGEPMRGKPAPDLYQEAARLLGVDAGSCIAIEDSANGARAATAAGMRVIVVARPGAPLVPGAASVSELDAELIFTWLGMR